MTDTSSVAGGRQPPNPNTFTGLAAANTRRGTPLYSNAGALTAARANAAGTSRVVGLAFNEGVEDEEGMPVQYAGPLSFTAAEWDAVTGESGGLTPGPYYLSQGTAGALTKTAPGSGLLVYVGEALSTYTLLIQIAPAVSLD